MALILLMAIAADSGPTVLAFEDQGEGLIVEDRRFTVSWGRAIEISAPDNGLVVGGWTLRNLTIRATSPAALGIVITSKGASVEDVTIENCRFYGYPGMARDRIAMNVGVGRGRGGRLTIRNCTVEGWGTGLDFHHAGEWEDVVIDGCRFVDCEWFGARLYHASEMTVTNSTFSGCRFGAFLGGTPGAIITGCRFGGNSLAGLAGEILDDSIISSCIFDGNIEKGLWFASSSRVIVSGCHIDQLSLDPFGEVGDGWQLPNRWACRNVLFTGCQMPRLRLRRDDRRRGIRVEGSIVHR